MEEPWGPAKPRMGPLHDPSARATHLIIPTSSAKPQSIREFLWGPHLVPMCRPTLQCGRCCGLTVLDLEMDYHTYEQWSWNGACF
ncbi:unnamed protein product [Menidia menidia]|uniref:(Atlantic silverside) hypothetical protein n=1 Tax=Menidia menidia TaxID=238744 RepID=A0A8S4AKQ5_9TELE|nr:unnamed protein product [Menidia menidia]